MLTANLIGKLSLNSSFILYLIIYLPQIVHNRHEKHLANLSIHMHWMLYVGYFLDLFYGFSYQLQWQYKTVSIVSLGLLTIQHIQIVRGFWKNKQMNQVCLNLSLFLLMFIAVIYFFNRLDAHLSPNTTLIIGNVSRIIFLIYCLPQIVKNRATNSSNAINVHFIYLSLTLSVLDFISAWCLDWGWPNKLAAPISVVLMLILLKQRLQAANNI